MLLQIFGSIGIGLVWGWLLGLLFRPDVSFRPINWKKVSAAGAGIVALAGVVFAFLGWIYTVIFIGSALLAFLAHRSWLASLQRQAENET